MIDSSLKIEEIPLGSSRLKTFVDFPWHIHCKDDGWTPPLRGELIGNRMLGMVGLLTSRHPYHEFATVNHFLAWRDGELVGRVAASINRRFNEHHHCRVGFFGFWDTVNDYSVASALLDAAQAWVKSQGMAVLRGPGEYSNATHERQGVLIYGFEHASTMDCTHNPPYYSEFLEKYGFQKAKDYYAYVIDTTAPMPERLGRLREQVKRRNHIVTRVADIKDWHNEVRLVQKIYNEAWSHNWGFLPVTNGEADLMAESLRPIVDPELVRFAYVDGEPAAVLGAFPDAYHALRPRWQWYGDSDLVRLIRLFYMRRHIKGVRLMFFGVREAYRRMGIDALLLSEVSEYALEKGYRTCEASLLLEDNFLILSPSEFMGGQHYKTWRIYDLPLS